MEGLEGSFAFYAVYVRASRARTPSSFEGFAKKKIKYIFVIIVNINTKTMLQVKRLILISLHPKLNTAITGNSITNLPPKTSSACTRSDIFQAYARFMFRFILTSWYRCKIMS